MFLGRCLVSMADGSAKPISDIVEGDLVLCCKPYIPGKYVDNKYVEHELIATATMTAEVQCLLVYPELSYAVAVRDSNLVIRERHPIKDPRTGVWVQAMDLRPEGWNYLDQRKLSDEIAYHILLSPSAPSNTIVVDGIICASIGAYLAEGLGRLNHHSWFSEYESVAEEMRDVDPAGWQKGRVEVTGIRRSGDDDGSTCGFRMGPGGFT